jgi:calcineurin-like phosphoesterase family protein
LAQLITSDTHFGHLNLTQAGNPNFTTKRPFKTVVEMNEALIANWNAVVKPDDEVFHLGDVCMGQSQYWKSTLDRLNGKINLIIGNHDERLIKECAYRFEWIKPYHELYTQDPNTNQKIILILCHYPLLTWNKAGKGSIMAHGHCHNNITEKHNKGTRRIDVGVDNPVANFAPISLKKLCKIMEGINYTPVDHHGKKEDEC